MGRWGVWNDCGRKTAKRMPFSTFGKLIAEASKHWNFQVKRISVLGKENRIRVGEETDAI
jgi:hypothetical protein